MNACGDQFFSRAALSDNQYRTIQRRNARDMFKYPENSLGLTNQLLFLGEIHAHVSGAGPELVEIIAEVSFVGVL